ncbi:MAG: MBL fold metallo-hydrolase [Pseudomonadota bacterium]
MGTRRSTLAVLAIYSLLVTGCAETINHQVSAVAAAGQSIGADCDIEIVVLGAGQDAGAPQIGYYDDPAWHDPSLQQTATSIALIDHPTGSTYLFDAAPHIGQQLQLLEKTVDLSGRNLGLSGVFLTHAHIGHYAGLMYLGHEAAGTTEVPVYAMPRMREFLERNGPWEQLVQFRNIDLKHLSDRVSVELGRDVTVTPYRVPHRDEYSETVGFLIDTAGSRVLYLPDIDSWAEWESEFGVRIEEMIEHVDLAFIDATFYSDNELPGRDMSKIPHPRVSATMDLLDDLQSTVKSRVHFIHYNHTNPIRFSDSEETGIVIERGFRVARSGDRHCPPVSEGATTPPR